MKLFLRLSGLACAAAAGTLAGGQTVEPTEYDQYALELVNRARANPAGEVTRTAADAVSRPGIFGSLYVPYRGAPGLNEGPPRLGGQTYTIPAAAKQPLAFNPQLMAAARSYAAVCQANNNISHSYNDGGTTPDARMRSRGYVPAFPMADALQLPNGSYTAPGSEMLSYMAHSSPWTSTPQGADLRMQAVNVAQHGLFVDTAAEGRGHRMTMMAGSFREAGIAFDFGTDPGGFYSSYAAYTLSFRQGSGPFITGVAYRDMNGDGFYTPGKGEALGQVDVTVRRASGEVAATVKTSASGGYAAVVPANGTYTVVFSGQGIAKTVPGIAVADLNRKVDCLVGANEPPVTPAFVISEVSLSGSSLVLKWSSEAGAAYRVAAWSSATSGWTVLAGSQQTGNGGTLSFTHQNALSVPFRLYRVEKL